MSVPHHNDIVLGRGKYSRTRYQSYLVKRELFKRGFGFSGTLPIAFSCIHKSRCFRGILL
jgi:hypothetical protein